MWLEYLSEIVPGLVILGYLLLWWQAHLDIHKLRREWEKKFSELASTLAKADSWEEAIIVLKAYTEEDSK